MQCKTNKTTDVSVDTKSVIKAFADKVEGVRTSTANAPYPEFIDIRCNFNLDTFAMVDEAAVTALIKKAANKNSMLDPIPTWIVKQYVDILAPFVTILFNASIQEGRFSASQKAACVTPVLKKSSLDQDDLNNYRPISNLTFLSKVLERCIYEQMIEYQINQHERSLSIPRRKTKTISSLGFYFAA